MNLIETDLVKQTSALKYVEQFKRDGYVVIENAIPNEVIVKMRESFLHLMEDKIKKSRISPVLRSDERHIKNDGVKIDFRPEGGNHDLNRWNMHVPSTSDFINNFTLAHPKVLNVIKTVMGADPVAFLLASDTPYPGSGFQNIHQDFPRFGITVNIPLVDFTEENAPLEVWPSSHIRGTTFTTDEVNLSKVEIKDLANRINGRRLLIKAGSIVIRDQRLVHRGTANISNQPRPCLSFWYKNINSFDITGLTIPTPHRSVANFCARVGKKMRLIAKGNTGHIMNQALLNWGNFFGRIVEECSASDRDHRRVISSLVWHKLSPESRQLLRMASVEGEKPINRSMLGSSILLLAAGVFCLVGAVHVIRNFLTRGA